VSPDVYAPPTSPPPRRLPAWLVLSIVALVVAYELGYLAIRERARDRQHSKTDEATRVVQEISRLAAGAHARDGALCDSAGPVPTSVPAGRKFQSLRTNWDSFDCLGFSTTSIQRYQYTYMRAGDAFVVVARGDLDGDGILSEFSQRGAVRGGVVELDAEMQITDGFE
jgi:hypothetical protein